MGVSAAVVGFRQAVERGSVVVQTDDCLVGRARAGDDAAFEAIYDRYARGVLAFCVHMLGSRESAEDALQLTFVSAYRALRGGESNISLRPWLYTIARNRCLSELRTRREGVDVDGVALDRPFVEGLADQVQRREQLREMLEDMQRLPADQRAALVLFELGDHSHKEIAAVLGVRTEKVKALIFQAREALVRGRQARNRPCAEIRERLATSRGRALPRSMTRAHIDRCPSCAAFEGEVRRQRAALALILPVTLTGGLKASVLGSALRGGGTVAAGAGACGSGAAVAGGASAGGAGAVVAGGATATAGAGGAGGLVAGGATAAAGAGAVAAGSSAAGSLAAGTAAASTAVIAGAPSVAAVATGLTAVGADYAASAGVGALGATGVLAKILTVAAIATGGAGAIHASSHGPPLLPGPPAALQLSTTSASPATAPTIASNQAATTSAVTPSATATTTTTTPAATPSATATTTTTTPAATPSATATTTTTTPAATPSATATTTTPAATPSATTPPNEAPAATDPVPDPTTAQAMVDAIARTAATSG
jgi:RNA polymerase sigma factor (sigma-70 family)